MTPWLTRKTPTEFLLEFVHGVTLLYLVVTTARLLFIEHPAGILQRSPMMGIVAFGISALVLLPWKHWVHTPEEVGRVTVAALALTAAACSVSVWFAGLSALWVFPLVLLPYASITVILALSKQSLGSPVTGVIAWGLVIWLGFWAFIWWAVLDGPASETQQAQPLARITLVSTLAMVVTAVVLNARVHKIPLAVARHDAALAFFASTIAFTILVNAFSEWLSAHTENAIRVPVSLLLWPILIVTCSVLWVNRRSDRLLPIAGAIGLVWQHSMLLTAPYLASYNMMNTVVLWVLAFHPRRWTIPALGWALSLTGYLLAPGTDPLQVKLMGLSSTAVGLLLWWQLRALAADEATPHQPADRVSNEPTDPLIDPVSLNWARLGGVIIGVIAVLLGITANSTPSIAFIQAMGLLGLFLGSTGYTALRFWFEKSAQQRAALELNELRKSDALRRQLELVLQSAQMGWFEVDHVSDLVTLDAQAMATWGLAGKAESQVVARAALRDRVHPEDRAKTNDIAQQAASAAPQTEVSFRVIWDDGSVRWVEAVFVPAFDRQGRTIRRSGFVRDVTRERDIAAAMAKARADADQANLAKSMFLATMSHEIRTPLNAIVGMSRLLILESRSTEQRRDLEVLKTSSDHLLSLIDDILDFSKIEANQLDIEARPFNLAAVLRGLDIQFAGSAQAKGLALEFLPLGRDLPAMMVGDSGRLKQVLINLVSNAIKFTHSGRVVISVSTGERRTDPESPASRASAAGDAKRLTFRVLDTGIGLSEAALAGLFEPFRQADSSTTRRYGGTGLGLAIAKNLVELMGGKIRVSSQPGQGSVFEFDLPLGPVATQT